MSSNTRWCALHPTVLTVPPEYHCYECQPNIKIIHVKEEIVVGRKDDAGKARWDLLPFAELEQVVLVLNHGAEKYGEDNWQKVASPRRRYFAACVRHLIAWWKGEVNDKDSNLPHLAHAICCLLFLMWFMKSSPSTEK